MYRDDNLDNPPFRYVLQENWKDYEYFNLNNKYAKDMILIDISDIIYQTPFASKYIKDKYFPDEIFLESWFYNIEETRYIDIICELVLSSTSSIDYLLDTINTYVTDWSDNGYINNELVMDAKLILYSYTVFIYNILIDILYNYNIKELLVNVDSNYDNYIKYNTFGKIIDISPYNTVNKDKIICSVYLYRKYHENRNYRCI
jgi:hypothetical protein